jgi:pimeloyl-ACP methyl ester carboxylesterase
VSPVPIHYREFGAGAPLVILHGGWGYDIYPFDRQIAALSSTRRIIVPDRTGYGRSGRLQTQEPDFHRRAAAETFAVIEALGLERPVLWGHSDGAVIALWMGLDAPERLGGLIVEATHLFRNKPASREFFETMRDDPEALGERVASTLAREHGDGWRHLLAINGTAWLQIAIDPLTMGPSTGDLYDGRLPELRVPTLVIHGARDPRTEPGELEALRAAEVAQDFSPALQFEILPDGGHSPHSERATSDEVTRIADRFLAGLDPARPASPAPPAQS